LATQLQDAGATYLCTVPSFLDKATEAAAQAKVREIFVFGEAAGATPFTELLQGDGQLPAVSIHPRDDVAVLPYSSGTVGRPKGVMLTHYNLTAVLQQIAPLLPDRPGDRVLGVLPFFHIFGLQVLMNYTLRHGITCVTMPRFDLEAFLRDIQDYRITHLYLVPPLLLALAKHPLVDQYDLSSLPYILAGAAPVDGAVQQAVAARLQVPVVQGYGMTETSLAIAVTPPDPSHVKLGAVGVLLPNMEGTVVDPMSGAELGPHERGELLVRGPNIMRGYLNNPDATRVTIDPEGWLHTGDIAYVDDEGYLFIVDRLKELIKYKGMQVAPAELEGVLLTHPAIADAAVIGIPDAEAGEVPKAFVVLKAVVTPEALMHYVASQVAPHKRIRQVDVVDAIPKTASGKILRRVLVEREQAQRVGHTIAL
jgi:acyl-CoA synthetase (AMP-forming)/AMP-acid ligase II